MNSFYHSLRSTLGSNRDTDSDSIDNSRREEGKVATEELEKLIQRVVIGNPEIWTFAVAVVILRTVGCSSSWCIE